MRDALMEAHRHTDKVKKLIVASCLLTRQVIQFYLTGESNQILVCRKKKALLVLRIVRNTYE